MKGTLTGLCSWCGLHPATRIVLESESCDACARGGRRYRIDRYHERLERSAQPQDHAPDAAPRR